jgi:BirA family transcriptional regulator, biotin operon repressor / biotin---[acetyl-CoA-carboxylase] ligase
MATAAAPPIVRLGRVASTQTIAFTLAAEGAPDGTVVIADSQTAGRGRRGHAWLDEPGASLLASIVMRPRLEPARLPGLSLAAAVAVAEALTRTAGVTPRLKWPNDVLVGGRKLAGILLETRLSGEQATTILGIGVNLSQRVFPADLVAKATSVWLVSGRLVDRDSLLAGLLDALGEWRRRLERQGFAPIRTQWRALADTLGRAVTVDGVSGIAVDVDADGALVVADGDGRRRRVVAGEVV